MVYTVGVFDIALLAARVADSLELVHRVHTYVDIRHYIADIRAVSFYISLQKRNGQNDKRKDMVHSGDRFEDSSSNNNMCEAGKC